MVASPEIKQYKQFILFLEEQTKKPSARIPKPGLTGLQAFGRHEGQHTNRGVRLRVADGLTENLSVPLTQGDIYVIE